jgi:hypothetical protein
LARSDLTLSPKPDCPVNSITYHDAAAFCEWLKREEHLPASYRLVEDLKAGPIFEPLPGYLDRPGYRLVIVDESIVACRAGTATSRYFGDSESLWGITPTRTSRAGAGWTPLPRSSRTTMVYSTCSATPTRSANR